MANLNLTIAFAALVSVTVFIQAVRPLPVIVESNEFERGTYGYQTEDHVGDKRRLHSVGPHVKRESTIDIPKLVQDLYRNVTAISDSQGKHPTMPMDYNTVRSFEGSINEGCKILTFDAGAIEDREFIFKAEVYLDIFYSVDLEIELGLTGITRTSTKLTRSSTVTTSQETVVFPIGKFLADQVDSKNFTGNLQFSLEVWKIDGNSQTKLSCNTPGGELEIRKDTPSLVVYSYDTKEELLETIQKKLLDSSYTTTTMAPSVEKRDTKESDEPCQRAKLEVDKKVLNDIMKGTYRTIAGPEIFDTGVCGGHCIGNLPQETLHSSILHLLLTSTPNEPAMINDTTSYQKCCAPVEYSAMSMITVLQKPNEAPVFEIKVFHDLSVKRCACIYSRKYANEP